MIHDHVDLTVVTKMELSIVVLSYNNAETLSRVLKNINKVCLIFLAMNYQRLK